MIGWGSTRGSIEAAVEACRSKGHKVSSIHLRYIHPFPGDLEEIFARFDRLLVPELNNGQLVRILRDRYLLPFEPYTKIQGQPFKASEITARIESML